jgi:hypothetical protein
VGAALPATAAGPGEFGLEGVGRVLVNQVMEREREIGSGRGPAGKRGLDMSASFLKNYRWRFLVVLGGFSVDWKARKAMALVLDDVNKSCPVWCIGRASRGVLHDPKHKCTACANRARYWLQFNNHDTRPAAVIQLIPGSKLTDSVTVDSRERAEDEIGFAAREMYLSARRGHAPGVDFWFKSANEINGCRVVPSVVNAKHFLGSTPLHVSSYRVSASLPSAFAHSFLTCYLTPNST